MYEKANQENYLLVFQAIGLGQDFLRLHFAVGICAMGMATPLG